MTVNTLAMGDNGVSTAHPHELVAGNGFLRLPQVLKIFPVSKSTWWAGVKSGRYPAGVKISTRVTAWRANDIAALVAKGPFPGVVR